MWKGFGWFPGVKQALERLSGGRRSAIAPSTVRHKLMRRESENRLAAAETLTKAQDESDTAYLLRLLAFELLLKLLVEVTTGFEAPKHHHFHKLFRLLPQQTQTDLLRVTGQRIGPSALTTNHISVLKDLGRNFVTLRYPFEKYSDMTETEYRDAAVKWLTSGAPTSRGDFRYHPEELFGLTTALKQVTRSA
jgi:hypothetical protein